MTTTAVVLIAVWFVTTFAVRIAIQVRRTGDTGVRAAASLREAAGIAKLLFLAATLGVAAGPLLAALDVLASWSSPTWLAAAGVVLAGTGILATFAAQLDMGRSWRIGVDPGERTGS